MKKIFITLLAVFLLQATTYSQSTSTTPSGPRVEIAPMYGWGLNGSIKFYQGKFKMENAASYGGALSVELMPGTMAEFSYLRSDTEANFYEYGTGNYEYYDIAIEYYQLGVVKHLLTDKIRPYGTATLGLTRLNFKDDPTTSDGLKFSITLGGGIKYFVSDRVGIRLQGRLLMPLYFNGAGFYFGSGGSSGLSLNSSIIAAQGEFTGGLIFVLGN